MHSELLLLIVLLQIGLHLLLQVGYGFYKIISNTDIVKQYGRDYEPNRTDSHSVRSRSNLHTLQRTSDSGLSRLSAMAG